MPQTFRRISASQNVLGEGPLWADGRLWWCDITPMRLHSCRADGSDAAVVQFGERVSALGRLKDGGLLIASETALFAWNPATGTRREIAALEADNPATRSNDGRADRQGGFWIGTMAKTEQAGAGAFYRYFKGELRCLLPNAHIPNAQCFSPDGKLAYLADTPSQKVLRWKLDGDGWPVGAPVTHIDFTAAGLYPDGAVTDSAGGLWCAFYGAGMVARFDEGGRETERVLLPASQTTCPAFGGPDLRTVFVTSARQNLTAAALAAEPQAGDVFAFDVAVPGLPEPLVDA